MTAVRAGDAAERLDVAIVRLGLARSRSAAAAAVAAGRVRVDDRIVTRSSTRIGPSARVLVDPADGWVGRGAAKLDAALGSFAVDPAGRLALDLGASTGGFTQVLLARGARRVIALDVGHDQIAPELRVDPRVTVVEGENARWLTARRFAELSGDGERPGVVVADLSFISLTVVLPAIADVADPDADIVCLIKPQFEVGRPRVRSGVVLDARHRAGAVRGVLDAAWSVGLGAAALAPSPVLGTHGNREVLVHLHRSRGRDPAQWTRSIGEVVAGPDGEAW